MNEMKWTSDGKTRKMRKADQYRWNPVTEQHEIYQIDVPVELEDWEKEGLEKQRQMRVVRAAKKPAKDDKKNDKSGNGEETDGRNSEILD